jgi:phosphoadenosine phosphosulfate reductase
MKITMVKKIKENGEECRKCLQVTERLRTSNELSLIDKVVYADERNPDSGGFMLAKEHNIDIAPFFIVEDKGDVTIYKTYMDFKKQVLSNALGKTGEIKEKSKAASRAALDIERLNEEFEGKTPREVLEWGLKEFHPRIALAWSGAEDVAVVDMLVKINPKARIFTLDTGRLNPETYDLIERVRERYGIDIEVMFPDAAEVEEMVRGHGVNLFYQSIESRQLCCNARKVQPLKRMLSTLDAWITGLRRDQAVTRTLLKKIEIDEAHGGIMKLNPIAEWTNKDVWDYIHKNKVPYNELHDKGYPSIGCAPCTRAVKPGEDIRAGRWWWESPEGKECGLHVRSKR